MTRKTDFRFLFDEQYAPITSSMGFIEADVARATQGFVASHRECGITMLEHRITGPLARVLETLPPLTVPLDSRCLLVPTAGPWTAYFDNSKLGTDASSVMPPLARWMKCRTLRIDATPDSMGTKSLHDPTRRGRYGGCLFDLYGWESGEWGNTIRSIYAANDSRWKFGAYGTPLPFEEPEYYTARRIPDRFPFELLDRYCRALGIRAFDEDFYLPHDQPAILIERVLTPELKAKTKEFTLAELQAEWRR